MLRFLVTYFLAVINQVWSALGLLQCHSAANGDDLIFGLRPHRANKITMECLS